MDAILPKAVDAYLHGLQTETDPVLAEMERSGNARGFPIIGPLVGRFCATQARAIGARTVFEMGSGFGYSTFHFARAVGPQGRVVHTDGDAAKSEEARTWLGKAGLASRTEFLVGDARELLRQRAGPYDIVFCDIDKEQYPEAWRLAAERVRVGGVILTDNTLWSGRVADPRHNDAATEGVREYNRMAFSDARFASTLVPLRDGVTLSLRVK